MKVLVVAPFIEPDKTVGAVRVSCLTRCLVDNGIDVFLLTRQKEREVQLVDSSHVRYIRDDYESHSLKSNFRLFHESQKNYRKAFIEMITDSTFDIVIITGGPFYTFSISMESKKRGIPCLLDFRDPWSFDIRENNKSCSVKQIIRRLYKRYLESSAIKSATAVVTVTDIWKKMFEEHYPSKKGSIFLIENGYDDTLLQSISFPGNSNQLLSIGVFGKLFYYSRFYSNVFLQAIQQLGTIRINQIGARESVTDDLLVSYDLPLETVNSTGFISYAEGIKELNKSTIFLIVDAREGALGTKIYDYIYLNKPILYVGPKNTALANLTSSFENGFVCSSADEVVSAIDYIRDNQILHLTSGEVDEYARSRQNQKWLKLIYSVYNDKGIITIKD